MKFSSTILFLAFTVTSSADAFVSQTATTKASVSSSSSTTRLQVFDFFKEGKKKLVKSLAGDYDEEAIKARVEGLIETNPVLMFSFTT